MEGQGVDKTVQCEENSSYELMAHRGQQKIALETEGPVCAEGQSVRTKPLREHTAAVDPKESYELMASSFDAPKRCDLTREDFGGGFVLPADTAVPDRCRGDGVTYVNIPVSPSASKQLHYMELELQEPLSGVRGAGNSRYALIDIAVTETAHRVGAQHALCREERLQDLQQKKRELCSDHYPGCTSSTSDPAGRDPRRGACSLTYGLAVGLTVGGMFSDPLPGC